MRRFLTADWHLNHYNIMTKYCDRPFKTIESMNRTILRNVNEMVKPEDTLYHLGDLILTSGKEAKGSMTIPKLFTKINCNFINILGNHDRRNRLLKNSLNYAVLTFGKLKFLLLHVPPLDTGWEEKKYDMTFILPHIDIVLCGHVHKHWLYKIYMNVPFINVGVDMWKFRPIKFDIIYNLAINLLKRNNVNVERCHVLLDNLSS